MKEDTCILCRRPAALGLHIMGCVICFSCERKLVKSAVPPPRRRRLLKLYRHAGQKRACVFPSRAV
ncbi:MAG: hypothetical protein IKO52_06865 [Clostridia bacterium]|nr:hypothetical protein [Clostridia bacterium]